MSRNMLRNIERNEKPSDLMIRQKTEAMIAYGYIALRQFPKFEKHVLAAEIRVTMLALLRLIIVCGDYDGRCIRILGRDTHTDERGQIMSWVLRLLRQRSTWSGLVMIATAGGVALSPEKTEAIIGAGIAVVGMIDVFVNQG